MTTRNNLRELRKTLDLTQKEMGALPGVDCSQHMVCSIEIGRLPLSTRLASRIAESTGIDLAWLMSGGSSAPIDHEGRPFTRETLERQQANLRTLEGSHYRLRNLQLGTAFDLLHRILGANRVQGKDHVDQFMDRLEKFIKTELSHHVRLEDAVHGERRRAREAALKTGKIIPLGFLSPLGPELFRRGRERLGQALASFTARNKPNK